MTEGYTPIISRIIHGSKVLLLGLGAVLLAGNAWAQLSGYSFQKRLDVDNAQVSGSTNFTEFPVLVDFTDADLRTTANGGNVENANGWDIVFTDSDATTLLNHQLISYDGTTGRVVAWVQLPTLQATSDTKFYIFYGNASVSSDPSTDATWNSDWKGVWHLEETGSGTAGEYKDATANGNDGQGGAGDPARVPSRVTGKIGYAQHFDGADDYINSGSGASLNIRNAITMTAWVNIDQRPPMDDWLNVVSKNEYSMFLYGIDNNTTNLNAWFTIDGTNNDLWDVGNANLATGTWHYLVLTYDGTDIKGYINGNLDWTFNDPGTIDDSSDNDLVIAHYTGENMFFDGPLDEIRLAGVARSQDWIITEYNNQDSPGSFIAEVPAPFLRDIEGTALQYTAGDPPTAITDSITVSDPQLTDLQGATVQITGNYVSGEDVLDFTNTVNIVGSWDPVTGTLTLSGTAPVSEYQAALRSVTYENTETTIPNINTRTVSFTVDNGTYLSNTVSRDITITGIYDAVWESSNGAQSTSWDHNNNWNTNSVPGPGESAYIPAVPAAGTDMPIVDVNNQTVGSVVVEAGADITVSGGITFIIQDDLQGGGEVNGSASDVVSVSGDLNIASLSIGEVLLNGSTAQTIYSPLSITNLTIDHSGPGVIVNGDLTVSGTLGLTAGTLTIPSGNSLIANTKSIGSGQLAFERIVSGSKGWRMIGSPVASTYADFLDSTVTQGYPNAFYGTGSLPGDTLQPNVFWYDETYAGTDNQRWRIPGDANNNMTGGRGLFVYVFGDIAGDPLYNNPLPDTLRVLGQEHEGDGTEFDFNVTYTATADTGWNFVANPFGATIDWDAAGWTKTAVDNVIYVWDPEANGGNGEFLTWNGSTGTLGNGLIPPFQGFWVKANGPAPVLRVAKSNKTTGGQFYRKQLQEYKAGEPVVKLRINNGDLNASTILSFGNGADSGRDIYDAYRLLPFTDTFLELFTTLDDGTQMAINNLPQEFEHRLLVPLHVGGYIEREPISGNVTMTWPELQNIPGDWLLTLIDHRTGAEIDLRTEESYSFTMEARTKSRYKNNGSAGNFELKNRSEEPGRFTLRISTGEIESTIPQQVYLNQNYPNPFNPATTISFGLNEDTDVTLNVYDILGRNVRTLISDRLGAGIYNVNFEARGLASGVYIYRLTAGDRSIVRKFTFIK